MDNENKNESSVKKDENRIKSAPGKEIKKHLWMFLLVAFGVLLYVGLNHLDALFLVVRGIIGILAPLLIGALIALILNTPMQAIGQFLSWISKKLFGRKKGDYVPNLRAIEISSLVLTVLLALLLIYIIVYSVVPQLIESIKAIILQVQANMPEYMKILDKIDAYGIDTDYIKASLASIDLNAILAKITANAGNILDTVISSASSIISGTFTAITSVIFALYVLATKRTLSVQLKKLTYAHFRKETVDRGVDLCRMTTETFSNFISGQCLDAVILGLMCFVAMTIFRFPYALAISAMITITAIIPYVGAFLGGLFGVILMIIDSPLQALLFVVLFIIVQQIDNHLVYPRVVGNSVGLPPIWTFVAVIVGGSIWGVIGMVIFIPIFSVIYTLIKNNVAKRLDERGIVVEEVPYAVREKKPGRISTLISGATAKIKEKIAKSKENKENKE